MNTRKLICVICPNGCELEAVLQENPVLQVVEVTGNLCDKGPPWAEQEITNPMRTIASNILVVGGDMPLVSVLMFQQGSLTMPADEMVDGLLMQVHSIEV